MRRDAGAFRQLLGPTSEMDEIADLPASPKPVPAEV